MKMDTLFLDVYIDILEKVKKLELDFLSTYPAM